MSVNDNLWEEQNIYTEHSEVQGLLLFRFCFSHYFGKYYEIANAYIFSRTFIITEAFYHYLIVCDLAKNIKMFFPKIYPFNS